jgi:hypothetical protein
MKKILKNSKSVNIREMLIKATNQKMKDRYAGGCGKNGTLAKH